MKKLTLLALAVLGLASTAALAAPATTTEMILDPNASPNQAQHASNADNELGIISAVGVQLGPNVNTVTSTSPFYAQPDASGRTRMMFGANAQIGLYGMFQFQPEVNFVQRGFTETTIASGRRTDLEIGMNYLEFPLLIKIRPEIGSRQIRPYALVGPSLAMRLSSSAIESTRDESGQVSVLGRADREEGYSTFALSLHFGLGAEFALTDSLSALAGLRYVAGLTNLASGSGGSLKANAVQLVGGMQFSL